MEFLQEMALSHGGYFNAMYMIQPEDAAFLYTHKTHHCNGLVVPSDHLHHHQQADGIMDETNLALQASAASSTSPCTSISPNISLHDFLSTNSLGQLLATNFQSQACEMPNGVVTFVHDGSTKRRSWQEALSGSPHSYHSRTDNSITRNGHALTSETNQVIMGPDVDNILTLHHIQGAASTDHPNYFVPNCLTTPLEESLSAAHENRVSAYDLKGRSFLTSPLEESLISADENRLPAHDLRGRSSLSVLRHGDQAFFQQQIVVPMEDHLIDYPRAVISDHEMEEHLKDYSKAVISDNEEVYDSRHHHQDPVSCFMLPHGFAIDKEVLPPTTEWRYGYFQGHQESSLATDLSTGPSRKMESNTTALTSCGHANMSKRSGKSVNVDEKLKSASEDSTQSCSDSEGKMVINGATKSEHNLHLKLGGLTDAGMKNKPAQTSELKKRSLHRDYDGTWYRSHSKRAHLGSHVTETNLGNLMKHSSTTTSLTMMSGSSNALNATPIFEKGQAKCSGKTSSRHPLGPALNTNLKPRARQGTAKDPQTIAARNRRERINARLKILQELVPNGSQNAQS